MNKLYYVVVLGFLAVVVNLLFLPAGIDKLDRLIDDTSVC